MNTYLKAIRSVCITYCFSSIFHFLFGWLGRPHILSYILPINEAIIEHVKIVMIPVFIGFYPFYRKELSIGQIGIIGGIASGFMIILYYVLKGAFGLEGLVVDLINLAVVLLISTLFIPWIKKLNSKKCLAVTISIFLVSAVITHHHPDIPLFEDNHHTEEHHH